MNRHSRLLQSVKRVAYKTTPPVKGALVSRRLPLLDCQLDGLSIAMAGPIVARFLYQHQILATSLPLQLTAAKKTSSPHPSEARKMTAETGQALEIRLFRATLSHLRPGPDMEPAHDAGGDPSNPSWYLPRGRKGWRSVYKLENAS